MTGQHYIGKLTSWFPIAAEQATICPLLTCHRHLKPGGYIEQVEISIEIKSDDQTITPDSPLVKFGNVCGRQIIITLTVSLDGLIS